MKKMTKQNEVIVYMVREGRVEDVVGPFGLGIHNNCGARLIQFCQENNLLCANTSQRGDSKRRGHRRIMNTT